MKPKVLSGEKAFGFEPVTAFSTEREAFHNFSL